MVTYSINSCAGGEGLEDSALDWSLAEPVVGVRIIGDEPLLVEELLLMEPPDPDGSMRRAELLCVMPLRVLGSPRGWTFPLFRTSRTCATPDQESDVGCDWSLGMSRRTLVGFSERGEVSPSLIALCGVRCTSDLVEPGDRCVSS